MKFFADECCDAGIVASFIIRDLKSFKCSNLPCPLLLILETTLKNINTELLEPKHRMVYSFRIDRKYRAIFICLTGEEIEIIAITKHYRK